MYSHAYGMIELLNVVPTNNSVLKVICCSYRIGVALGM